MVRLFYASCAVSFVGTILLGWRFYVPSMAVLTILFVLARRENRRTHERLRRKIEEEAKETAGANPCEARR